MLNDITKKTMNNPLAKESINALLLVCGEYGHIMSFVLCKAEGSGLFQQMNRWLRTRCKMLDQHVNNLSKRDYGRPQSINPYVNERLNRPRDKSHVDCVQIAYSDVCCEGVKDVESHWFCDVWPFAKRAPFADQFHKQKKINESTRQHHELSATFALLLSDAMLVNNTKSINHIFKSYKLNVAKKDKCSNQTDNALKEDMLKSQTYKKRFVIRHPMHQRWHATSLMFSKRQSSGILSKRKRQRINLIPIIAR